MKNLQRAAKNIPGLLSYFLLPVLLAIVASGLLVWGLGRHANSTAATVWSLIAGVLLGFAADMLKRSITEYSLHRKQSQMALRLLERDARDIFTCMLTYETFLHSKHVPAEVKRSVPPPFKLRYWQRLKQDNQFLLLANEPGFERIFTNFFELEEINDHINRANNGDRNAGMFAYAFFQDSLKKKQHAALLAEFIGGKGVEGFENELKKKQKK